MEYEPNISCTNAYDINLLDKSITISRLWFGMDESIYYPPLLWPYLRMDEKFDTVLCMAIKIKPVHMISYKLIESMPWILPSCSSLFSLILLLLLGGFSTSGAQKKLTSGPMSWLLLCFALLKIYEILKFSTPPLKKSI